MAIDSLPDIIETYMYLIMIVLDTIVERLGHDIVDTSEKMRQELEATETDLHKLEWYIQQQPFDLNCQYAKSFSSIAKGIIARIQGRFSDARALFQNSIGKHPSVFTLGWLSLESALVEHLSGNPALAYTYEEKGERLLRQLGVLDSLPPTNHCYCIIQRLKKEGRW